MGRWRRLAVAVVSGAVLGFSRPFTVPSWRGHLPIDTTGLSGLLALIAMVPLALMLQRMVNDDTKTPKHAYWLSFAFFVTHFFVVLSWMYNPVRDFAELPVVACLMVTFLPAGGLAAVTSGGVAAALLVARRQPRIPMMLLLPMAVTATEMLVNQGPVGGFSWGAVGYAFVTVPTLLQGASVVGVFGLSFFAVFINSSIAAAIASSWRRALPAVGLLAVWILFGIVRPQNAASTDVIRVGMIQMNDNEKLIGGEREAPASKWQRFTALQQRAVTGGADVVLWPEGSFPAAIPRDATHFDRLMKTGDVAPPAAVVGASGYGRGPDGKMARTNSAFFVDGAQNIVGRFDKTHLVPFGEYVPWPFGAIIRQFVAIGAIAPMQDVAPTTLTIKNRPRSLGAMICYEGVFPEIARALTKGGASVLVNLTEDRWYGISSMATQHLGMYAMRATENGRVVLRSTNTGISAWVDAYGGIHGETGLYVEDVPLYDVPLHSVDTIYTAVGDVIAWASVVAMLLLWWAVLLPQCFWSRPRSALAHALVAVGVVAVVVGVVHWQVGPGIGETRATQGLLLILFGLLTSIGTLSEKSWGVSSLRVWSALCVAFAVVALPLQAFGFSAAFVASAVMLFLAFRRRRHERASPTGA
jgi:apolipoprotein N-acyltransferase